MTVTFSSPNTNCHSQPVELQLNRLFYLSLQVLVAVLPQSHMIYFDVEEKQWKRLSSLAPVTDILNCYCAETVGRQLFVAGNIEGVGYFTYCYDIETNKWQRHEEALPCGQISSLCTVGDYMYAVHSDYNMIPQRYSFAKRQWQSFAKFLSVIITAIITKTEQRYCTLNCMYLVDCTPIRGVIMHCYIVLTQ